MGYIQVLVQKVSAYTTADSPFPDLSIEMRLHKLDIHVHKKNVTNKIEVKFVATQHDASIPKMFTAEATPLVTW